MTVGELRNALNALLAQKRANADDTVVCVLTRTTSKGAQSGLQAGAYTWDGDSCEFTPALRVEVITSAHEVWLTSDDAAPVTI